MAAPSTAPPLALSPAREAGLLALTLLGVWGAALGVLPRGGEGEVAPPPPLAYQVPFHALDFEETRVVRELLAAVDEMGWIFAEEGRWPDAARLEEEFVAPFFGPRTWTVEGFRANASYLSGAPPGRAGTAFLLDLQEARPGTLDPTHAAVLLADGRHRRLPDGQAVHLAVWIRRGVADPPPMPLQPATEGWLEVLPRPRSLETPEAP